MSDEMGDVWGEPRDGWQELAAVYSETLLSVGYHNTARHQSPQQYDGESGLACSIASCLTAFIKEREKMQDEAWRYRDLNR